MSSLSMGDSLRQFAFNIVAAQDAAKAQPQDDSTAEVATDLAKLPPADAQQGIAQSQQPQQQGVFPFMPAQQTSAEPTAAPPQTQDAPVKPQPKQSNSATAAEMQYLLDSSGQGGADPFAQQMNAQVYEQQRLAGATQRYEAGLQEGIHKAHANEQQSDVLHAADAKRLDAAAKMQTDALQEKTDLEAQKHDVEARFDPERLQIMQHKVEVEKQLDDWHNEQLQQHQLRQEEFRDTMLQMANEHPEDVWGNASIGGKIAGIIGIVGAGFAGQDASARIQATVQQAVAVQMRKTRYLEEANNQEQNIAATAEQMFGSKRNAIVALTANNLEILGEKLKQAASRFANPIAQANCMNMRGQVLQQVAIERAKLTDQYMGDKYKSLAAEVELRGKMGTMLQTRHASMGQNALMPLPGLRGGVDKQSHQKLAPIFGGGHMLLQGIDDIENLAHQVQEAEAHKARDLPILRAKYAALKDGLLLPWRNFADAGKKIEPGEQHLYDNTIPTFLKTLGPESITGEYAQLHEARDLIVKTLMHTGNAYGMGTSQFDPRFPLYQNSVNRIIAHGQEGTQSADTQKKVAADEIAAAARKASQKNDEAFQRNNPQYFGRSMGGQ